MKFKRNLLILTVILIGILIVIPGCLPTTPTSEEEAEEGDVPANGTISVAAGAATTNDTTPTLTLSSTGATYMAFSGDGVNWSAWVAYATTYSSFGVTTGEGCTSGDGTKTVYAKFKNDTGESATKVYDSIYLDTAAPTLSSAVYTDVGSGGTVNASDTVVFTFNDEMLTTTVTASTVATVLPLSSSKSYGTSPTVSWDTTLKICTVTLGTSPTLVVGTTTVNPTAAVTDSAGNADATATAVTITGSTATLSSVSISNSAVSTTTGGSTITLTAVATSTTSTVMTSSCTYTWSLYSGVGSISTGTTSTATYTPPSSGTGTAVVKVSVIKTGTTTPVKTATASTITVSAATTSSTTADATKLSVSAQNNTATYTDVPSGGSVSVYSFASDNSAAAEAAGAKFTITTSDSAAAITQGEAFASNTDYIYFKVYSGSSWTNLTVDGQIPVVPNADALLGIYATSSSSVYSPVAGVGNVGAGEEIKCYVSSAAQSAATTVGTTMAISPVFTAGDDPTYTRTNAAGHESVASSADGEILILNTATAANGTGTAQSLDEGDKITLAFWNGTSNQNIRVTLPITTSYLTWTPTSGSASLGTGSLATATAADSAVLTATSSAVDFADSSVDIAFNILAGIPIVDSAGGNFVLPWASDSDECFDSADF